MSTTYLPIPLNISDTEGSVKKLFRNKLKNIFFLNINFIQISEFMTRGQSLDEGHIENLMSIMKKEGYLPESSVWVNAITGANGEVLQYRLIAGRHRFEACRRLGIDQIPALIFEDLTDQEECLADRVSNEKDRRHKRVSSIEEARHILYLKEKKGWSIRQIARAKGISKSEVSRKIQIAKFPKSVQDIFVTVPIGDTFKESYFREISRLKSEPHQVLVCKKVVGEASGDTEDNKNMGEKKSLNASDIKKMVNELLLVEAQGKIAEEAMKYFNKDEKVGNISSIFNVKVEEIQDISIFSVEEEAWRMIMENSFPGYFDRRNKKTMRFGTFPLWLRHCREAIDLPLSSFYLLMEIVGNDLRYTPEKENFFFIRQGKSYENTEQYLSAIVGVKEKTLMKKLLPSLDEYIAYRKPGDILKFKVKWDKFFELYKRVAWRIPFHDGGLDCIPEDFTGAVFPTPFHCIYIENGHIKLKDSAVEKDVPEVEEKEEFPEIKVEKEEPVFRETVKEVEPEPTVNETFTDKEERNVTEESPPSEDNPVVKVLEDTGMGEKQVIFCINKDNIETTKDILKYIKEMKPSERDNIKNLPGYIYGMVKKGFTPPENFESCREREEKEIRKNTADEVGAAVRKGYRAGKIKYFCPGEGVKLKLRDVPNKGTFVFECDRGIQAGSFGQWPDEKYFR